MVTVCLGHVTPVSFSPSTPMHPQSFDFALGVGLISNECQTCQLIQLFANNAMKNLMKKLKMLSDMSMKKINNMCIMNIRPNK
jgi:hypothetical protein